MNLFVLYTQSTPRPNYSHCDENEQPPVSETLISVRDERTSWVKNFTSAAEFPEDRSVSAAEPEVQSGSDMYACVYVWYKYSKTSYIVPVGI